MYAPTQTVAPAEQPVTVPEAKSACRVLHDSEDAFIGTLVSAAVAHLDGYSGILGRCLVTQSWKQEFDDFARCLRLPLPAASITSVTYLEDDGTTTTTVASANYALHHDALGSYVRFIDDFSAPSGLWETKAVAVTFTAGYGAAAVVPANIKAWILANVARRYFDREAADWAYDGMLPPRRVGV